MGRFGEMEQEMSILCKQKLQAIYSDYSHDKVSGDKAAFKLRDKTIPLLSENYPSIGHPDFSSAFSKLSREIIADKIIDNGVRVDGRKSVDLRNIGCQTDLHDPLHGSALFQRGQTQVMCTVALDSLESALKSDAVSVLLGGVKEKNFFLHYEFPSYATNEIGRMGGPSGRRELGHGALAEKALKSVVPPNFPFTIRLTSEVLESNGSSSMASVCGGSLALMDAGVPLTEPAAGVAVGLVSRGNVESKDEFYLGQHAVLTDILGMEDYLGDMDFKVAGTRKGINALQADIKLPGLPFEVVKEAMLKGDKGINKILDIMEECIDAPRKDKSNLPLTDSLTIPITKRARFVGPGGVNLKKILTETGVQISTSPEDASKFNLFAPNNEAMQEAREIVKKLLESEQRLPEFKFGEVYEVM